METRNYHRGRRLYRDPENRVLGGVCSGLAYYFNVDVVIIRVIFILVTLWFALGFVGYLLLWVMVPQAATPDDFTEMKWGNRNN